MTSRLARVIALYEALDQLPVVVPRTDHSPKLANEVSVTKRPPDPSLKHDLACVPGRLERASEDAWTTNPVVHTERPGFGSPRSSLYVTLGFTSKSVRFEVVDGRPVDRSFEVRSVVVGC